MLVKKLLLWEQISVLQYLMFFPFLRLRSTVFFSILSLYCRWNRGSLVSLTQWSNKDIHIKTRGYPKQEKYIPFQVQPLTFEIQH